MARDAGGKAVPIDYDRLAAALGYAPQSIRKAAAKMRGRSWCFQEYRIVFFMTHERSEECPKGKWTRYVVCRYQLHRVSAKPGPGRQLRWHQRKGKAADWKGYRDHIFLWAEAVVFRGITRRDGKHKASPETNRARAGGARAPNSSSSAKRRWGRLAAEINSTFRDIPRATHIDLHGWAVLRLKEWHDRADIVRCLVHANDLYFAAKKRRQIDLSASWVSGVASKHLSTDGLTTTQRQRRNREREAGRSAPAFNDGMQAARPLRFRKVRR